MMINCGLKSPTASRKVDSEGTEAVSMRDLRAIFFCDTRPSSPFGLRPHCDEGRVSRFTLETGGQFSTRSILSRGAFFALELHLKARESRCQVVSKYAESQ